MNTKLLLLITCILFQYSYSQIKAIDSSTIKSISQLSYYHGELGRDSVVLSGEKDPEINYYSKVEIFRKGKKIYEIKGEMEFEGKGDCFTQVNTKGGYYYIFRENVRPQPDKFLVVKIEKDTAYSLGFTENSTAEIFGDIDRDGKFEIGGFRDLHDSEIYIFEIAPGFPEDKILTKKINEAKKESFKSKR